MAFPLNLTSREKAGKLEISPVGFLWALPSRGGTVITYSDGNTRSIMPNCDILVTEVVEDIRAMLLARGCLTKQFPDIVFSKWGAYAALDGALPEGYTMTEEKMVELRKFVMGGRKWGLDPTVPAFK